MEKLESMVTMFVDKLSEYENCCCSIRDKSCFDERSEEYKSEINKLHQINEDGMNIDYQRKSIIHSQRSDKNKNANMKNKMVNVQHIQNGQNRSQRTSKANIQSPLIKIPLTESPDISGVVSEFSCATKGAMSQHSMNSSNVMKEFQLNSKILVNKTEKKYEWTRNSIVKLFNETNDLKNYKVLLNEQNIKVSVHQNGTPMYKYAPLFKTEYIFDIKMEKVVAAMHNSETRMKWDNNVASQVTVKKYGRVDIIRIELQSHKLFNLKKEMLEKKFGFSHRPKIITNLNDSNGSTIKSDMIENYFFFSSLDSKESQEIWPVVQGFDRTHIHFGIHKFQIIKNDKNQKQVKLTMLLQMDLKLNKIKMGIYKTTILPALTKSFYQNLNGFLQNSNST